MRISTRAFLPTLAAAACARGRRKGSAAPQHGNKKETGATSRAHQPASCSPHSRPPAPAQQQPYLDVGQVELRVDVDQHAVLNSELKLARQLAVAVEDGARGVEPGLERGAQLVAAHQHRAAAKVLEQLRQEGAE